MTTSLQAQNTSAKSEIDLLTLEMHIMKGNKENVEIELSKTLSYGTQLPDLVLRSDNTSVLHIAAEAGQSEMFSCILRYDQRLLYSENDKGDLPIHVALKAGQQDAVWKLLLEERQLAACGSSNQLEMKNKEDNTALHIALDNRFEYLASELFEQCPQAFYQLNADGICPLYLAITARYLGLAKRIIQHQQFNINLDEVQNALKSTKSVIHAAIMARDQELTKTLINKCPELKYSLDDKGQTVLSNAAQIGFLGGVEFLMNEHPELACQQDEDGSYPIHKACSGGNLQVVREFFRHFSAMKCSLNKKNQNILHIAAENGKDDIVKYVLGQLRNRTEGLINMKDEAGNTPLHLATMGKHPKVVYSLTSDVRVQKQLQNKQGLTALDLAEEYYQVSSFEERLTWSALLYANVPRSSPMATGSRPTKPKMIQYKERVSTLLVVCTLVATVTFAATFTMPGGYRSSKQQEGMATLAHRRAFQVFVFSNTIAMYTAMFSAVTLIWAQLDDLNLSLLSLDFALPSLGIALTMMPVAFMAGSYVVLHSECNWLAIVVLIFGGGFLVAILAFFVPLYSPKSHIQNKFMRYLFHIVFKLMLLGCSQS